MRKQKGGLGYQPFLSSVLLKTVSKKQTASNNRIRRRIQKGRGIQKKLYRRKQKGGLIFLPLFKKILGG